MEKQYIGIHGSGFVKIPSPRFYVLYNGQEIMEDKVLLHLSDTFESPSDGFEWIATVLDINVGHNKDLLNAANIDVTETRPVRMTIKIFA